MTLQLTIDTKRAEAAVHRVPQRARSFIPPAIERSVMDMARSGKEFAPKADSLLTNSIQHEMSQGGFEGRVFAGVRHGRPVEQGTGIYGPAGIPSDRMPPVQSILDWIKVRKIQPNNPDMSEEDLAFVIARSIAVSGTAPQPYMEPAFQLNKDRAIARIDAAIDSMLAELQ